MRLPRSPLPYLLAALCVGAIVAAVMLLGPPASPAAQERVVTAAKGVVQSTVSGTGNLEPVTQLELDFATSGTVTHVYVKEGERVAEGQPLAKLDQRSAQVELAQAEANYVEAKDAVETAGTTSDASTAPSSSSATTTAVAASGSASEVPVASAAASVSQTTPVDEPTTTPQEETSTAPEQTSTTPEQTSTTPEQTGTTPEQTSTTPEQTGTTPEQAGTEQDSGQSQAPAQGGAGSSTGGSSGGAASDGAAADSGLSEEAAEANLESARLALEEAQEALEDTVLRAPVAGTVAAVGGAVGDTVSGGGSSQSDSPESDSSSDSGTDGAAAPPGGTSDTDAASDSSDSDSSSGGFFTLAQIDRLTLDVSFSESDIGKLKVGQAATVSINALPDVQLAARVTSIATLPDTSGSVVEYPVTLTLEQHDDQLKPGMTASAEVVVSQVDGAVNVPSQAVTPGPGGQSVTVRKDGKDQSTPVTTGMTGDTTTQIVSGLEAGDQVVIETAAAGAAQSPLQQSGGGGASRLGGGLGGAGPTLGGGGFGGGGPPGGP